MCAAPRHDSDVTAGDTEDFFVAAPYLCKYGLRLAGRSDVITLGDDCQQISTQLAQVYSLAANHQFTLHQPVVSIQVHNELPKRAASKRNVVGDPLWTCIETTG